MKLSDKIVTEEEYMATVLPDGQRGRDYCTSTGWSIWGEIPFVQLYGEVLRGNTTTRLPRHLWWMHREIARQQLGVYDPATSVLASIRASTVYGQYQPHISKEDPLLVAFTASVEDGIRDKQTRVALGRFLRKFSPWLSDKDIAALESNHRSELNPDVKLHVWADEYELCKRIYATTAPACMSKGKTAYHANGDVPLKCYTAPGWHLAVLYREGVAKARGIVWINPENPADKRQVRVYGDAALQTWLNRNDFAHKSFGGAYLYTEIVKGVSENGDDSKPVLCPYVDSGTHGQASRPESEQNGYGVWDGENRLYLIHRKDHNKYSLRTGLQTTAGYVHARPMPINAISVVSGKKINALTDAYVRVWHQGAVGYAMPSETTGWKMAKVPVTFENMYIGPGTETFVDASTVWVDEPSVRAARSYMKLDALFYPDEQNWIKITSGISVTTAGRWIKTTDVVNYVTTDKLLTTKHLSEVESNATRLAAIDDRKTFAAAGVEFVVTKDNRKVVPSVHPVTQLYNGTWAYTRHVRAINMFGTAVYVLKDADEAEISSMEMPQVIKNRIIDVMNKAKRVDVGLKKAIFDNLMDRGDCFAPLAGDQKAGFDWGYAFESDGLQSSVIRAFLSTPVDMTKNHNAKQAAVVQFHSVASKVLQVADEAWAAKTAATTTTAAVAA